MFTLSFVNYYMFGDDWNRLQLVAVVDTATKIFRNPSRGKRREVAQVYNLVRAAIGLAETKDIFGRDEVNAPIIKLLMKVTYM